MARKTTPTHILLNQITLAAASSSVTFSNIPQGYSDLVIVGEGGAVTQTLPVMRINDDAGSNYAYITASGTSVVFSGASTLTWIPLMDNTTESGGRVMFTTTLLDYSASDKHTHCLTRGNQTNVNGTTHCVHMSCARWANTSPVTSLYFRTYSGGNFAIGTTFSLYGVYA